MKKQNAGLIALSIVFILMGGFSTIYNLSKYVSNRVFMSSAEKTTGYVKWIDVTILMITFLSFSPH